MMNKNKVYTGATVLFMFLFIFMGVNNTSADSINNNTVFKSIKKINLAKNKSIINKEKEIKSIMDHANVNDLEIYNIWRINEFNKALTLLNEQIEKDQFVKGDKRYLSTLDDGTIVKITVKDKAENQDGSLKTDSQTNIWMKYGNRRCTYTVTVLTTSMKLINGYTINGKGLTSRYVKTEFSNAMAGIDLISVKWDKKDAVKIGDKINTVAQWKISVPAINATKVQKAYMKIVNWDQKNKKMLVGQTGTWL